MSDFFPSAAPQSSVDERGAEAEDFAARASALAERISQLTVVGTTAGGGVEVTLDSAGICTDLRLEPQVMRWTCDELADEIKQAMHGGHELMRQKVADLVHEVLGQQSSMGQAIEAGFAARVAHAAKGSGAVARSNYQSW